MLGCFRGSGSGFRVFWGSVLGLRGRSPNDHVILLILWYLTGVFLLFLFPHPLFPSHHWLLSHPPPLTTENVCSPLCPICWWDDCWSSCPQCSSPIGRCLSLWLIWWVILIEPILESYLQVHWERFLKVTGPSWCHWLSGGQPSMLSHWLGGKVSKVGCFESCLWSLY